MLDSVRTRATDMYAEYVRMRDDENKRVAAFEAAKRQREKQVGTARAC